MLVSFPTKLTVVVGVRLILIESDIALQAIEERRIQATLQFIILKKMNRLAHIRCKKVREGTNEVWGYKVSQMPCPSGQVKEN